MFLLYFTPKYKWWSRENERNKVVTTEKDNQDGFNRLVEALTESHEIFLSSLPIYFILISFSNNAIRRDGITELIAQQSTFLHNTVAISVVDSGNGDGPFHSYTKPEGKKGTILEWVIAARCEDNSFHFRIVISGWSNHAYFFCTKDKTNAEEEWIDGIFNRILTNYGSDKCKIILGEEHYIRRDKSGRTTPKIAHT